MIKEKDKRLVERMLGSEEDIDFVDENETEEIEEIEE